MALQFALLKADSEEKIYKAINDWVAMNQDKIKSDILAENVYVTWDYEEQKDSTDLTGLAEPVAENDMPVKIWKARISYDAKPSALAE